MKEIWGWCIERRIWLSASHIAGVDNTRADRENRQFSDNREWILNTKIFKQVVSVFGMPDIDLFSSRLNNQVPLFVTWRPEPGSYAVDAFSITWNNNLCYIFPPFNFISRVIQKILQDEADVILIAPHWTTQPLFAIIERLKILPPIYLPQSKRVLTLPYNLNITHPMVGRLHLSLVRQMLEIRNVPKSLADIIISSWR